MKRLFSVSLTLFTGICVLLATERRALAYIDPGSGMLALQSLAAAAAAAGYYLRRRIMGLFSRNKKPVAGVPVPINRLRPIALKKEASRNAA